ncbi:STAS domain-containing protein [Candidatus Omnitrophota bacterium]
MQIKETENNGIVMLSVEGDIDLNSSPQMRTKFSELIQKQVLKIIINFARVDYIDSSGLATLIEMLQRLKKCQGQLRLANVSDKIKSLFEVTKLDKLFIMYNSEEEALKDF